MTADSVGELAGGLRTVVNRLAYALRTPVARDGITPTRLAGLMVLKKHGPLRPSGLAERLDITAASASRLIDILLDGGWAQRAPDPADGRASLLSLSPQGAATLEKLRREGTGELATGIEELTADDRAALAAALPVLVALADGYLARADGAH
ncbi:MarR family winged helix-turn-helix transcriptional regulator [Flexivirga sp. B27]